MKEQFQGNIGVDEPIVRSRWNRFQRKFGALAVSFTAFTNLGAVLPSYDCDTASYWNRDSLPGIHTEDSLKDTFSAVTYNVAAAEGGLDRIKYVLAQHPSDIVFLQEVLLPDLHTLATDLGYVDPQGNPNVAATWTVQVNGEWFGNGFMSKLPIKSKRRFNLETGGLEPRALLTVELDRKGQTIVAAGTHLSNDAPGILGETRTDIRRKQMSSILWILEKYYPNSTLVFGGDIQNDLGSEIDNMSRYLFDDAAEVMGLKNIVTFPWDNSRKDVIKFKSQPGGLVPIEFSVWGKDENGITVGDHCPVGTIFKVNRDKLAA